MWATVSAFPLAVAVQEAAATQMLVPILRTLLIVDNAWPEGLSLPMTRAKAFSMVILMLSRRRTVLGDHVIRKTSTTLVAAAAIVSTVLPALFFFAM
jgi:hypothetical protein